MIFNPEKERERVNGKTLSYSEIGKMLLTNKRINGGFRKKISTPFGDHTKTSNDNMFSKNYHKMKQPPPPKTRDNPNFEMTVAANCNPLFGGSEKLENFVPKSPPGPSIEMVQAFDRQHTLPSDRCIRPKRRYGKGDTLTLSHSGISFGSERKERARDGSSSKQMQELLSYRFASHSCDLISPKITQASVVKRGK